MSTKNSSRKRPQKHQNTKVWKADKHKSDPKTKLVQNLTVCNCCPRCTEVIEWKIKYAKSFSISSFVFKTILFVFRYGKYKALSQPAKCTRCQTKRVKYAYHALCTPCVEESKQCAKCLTKEEAIVNNPEPSKSEASQFDSELQQGLKALPERKRRAFLRYLRRQEEGN